MSTWVNSGFAEYAKRLPRDFQINLIQIPAPKRTKTSNIENIKQAENLKINSAIPKNSLIIALDEHGKEWTTKELAKKLEAWQLERQEICMIIGGADGLAPELIKKANFVWSLSQLTFPHQLVKVFLAEQIYRAWSVINNHPYHRD